MASRNWSFMAVVSGIAGLSASAAARPSAAGRLAGDARRVVLVAAAPLGGAAGTGAGVARHILVRSAGVGVLGIEAMRRVGVGAGLEGRRGLVGNLRLRLRLTDRRCVALALL